MAFSSMMAGAMGGMGINIIIRATDQYSKEMKSAQTSTKKLGSAMKIAALGFAGAFALATREAAKFERTQISFGVMLGSIEKGNKMLKDLAEFTKKTPFKLTELEENARLLLGMGVESEGLIDTMKSLGDVSAGLNIPFERLAINFGQVKAQGRLMGTELRDFARGGVPIIAELAKNLNVSESAIKTMSSQGKISFKETEKAFRTMSSEGGIFADLMEKSMDTAEGSISNLQDSIQQLGRALGKPLLAPLTVMVQKVTEMVTAFNDMDEKTKSLVSGGIVTAGIGVIGTGAAIKGAEMAANLKGLTPTNPLYVSETNPLAMGSSKTGKTAAAGGLLTSATISGIVSIALPVITAAMAVYTMQYVAETWQKRQGIKEKDIATNAISMFKKILKVPFDMADKYLNMVKNIEYQNSLPEGSGVSFFRQAIGGATNNRGQPVSTIQESFTMPEKAVELSTATINSWSRQLLASGDEISLTSKELNKLAEVTLSLQNTQTSNDEQLMKLIEKQARLEEVTRELTPVQQEFLRVKQQEIELTKSASKSLMDMSLAQANYKSIITSYGDESFTTQRKVSDKSNVIYNPETGTWIKGRVDSGNRGVVITNNYFTEDNSANINKVT